MFECTLYTYKTCNVRVHIVQCLNTVHNNQHNMNIAHCVQQRARYDIIIANAKDRNYRTRLLHLRFQTHHHGNKIGVITVTYTDACFCCYEGSIRDIHVNVYCIHYTVYITCYFHSQIHS